ncbi:protein SGT1 homolog [Ischnura elegans]|uniref:protein SGT1 homolog n=1 Tax=Ischnura elegans TaxID=197161 RepID=UPI001ED87DAD|nr:protein SGT1 homolog [Ischnura elegans]
MTDASTGPNKPDSESQTSQPTEVKIKYDWYQTETHVVLTILAKNLQPEDVKIDYHETALSCSAHLPSGNDYSLELDLAHNVVPAECSHRVLASKIEIKLKKKDGFRWNSLEGDPKATPVAPIPAAVLNAPSSSGPPKYPSSSLKTRDWDKLVGQISKEEEEEKPDGDAALNALFQKIYKDGNDEVKKAMNKSFMESGGTVLSTNWSEVGKDKVDVKPPDGMEWRKWDT